MIRVVIADDHKLMREAVGQVLSSDERLDVIALCKDGAEAAETCRELNPDVVLMDINMHPVNGIDATRVIRTFSNTIKVIGLSMHNDYSYVKALIEAGANGYVTKSSGVEEIINAIFEALRGHEYLDPDINMLKA